MTIQTFIERYRPTLEEELQDLLTAPSPETHNLYGYLRYHMGWADEKLQPLDQQAGKRLRPIFCLLACETCGGDWQQAIPAAAAVELLHNFSLIHDDIEDGDTTRRGRPTVWALWGVPQALNAGDTMYALAYTALLHLTGRGVPAPTVIEAIRLFSATCMRLTEGQFLDMGFESQADVQPEMYLRMVAGKTAALLASSCAMGALIAGGTEAQRQFLHDFGHHLGLAFQIQDDVLGIWGDSRVTGKPVGADILRRKKTLPVVYGLQQSKPLRELLSRPDLTPEDAAQAAEWMDRAGCRDWAQERAAEQTTRALAALDGLNSDTPATNALRELALQLLERTR